MFNYFRMKPFEDVLCGTVVYVFSPSRVRIQVLSMGIGKYEIIKRQLKKTLYSFQLFWIVLAQSGMSNPKLEIRNSNLI